MFENKKDNQTDRLPFGLRDILPLETGERNSIKEIIRKEFKLWGGQYARNGIYEKYFNRGW